MSGRDRMLCDELAISDGSVDCPSPGGVHERQVRGLPSLNEMAGLVIGELLAITEGGHVPLVRYPGQEGTAAIAAQTLIDLYEPHVGRNVALMFDGSDVHRPVIIGILREGGVALDHAATGSVEVDADGERMIVSAREQLVLRCGKASITLTKAGKVLIQGTYVSSRSSGANRITGGAVQLN
ncbi:DUF6484 domain-containing protein [Paraburkholderia sp. IMGN_8]|uniref:DUF6484 domain-containing protein n=1 Tax=Paraburkholderia sp. IMGN_8 TaxID=3136564 RepID=UPI003101843A